MTGTRICGMVLAIAAAASTGNAQTAKLADKDLVAIKTASDAFAKTMVAGDRSAVVKLYSETASFLPPNDKAVTGRAAIQAWLQNLPPVKEMKLTPVEIDGRGDLAYVMGTFTMTLAPAGAPGPVTDAGKYVEIRRRQADGSWLISVDIFNSDLPAPR
jgi:ketosteroid isomerase-like protein